jgi:hypothetical protein
MGLMPPLCGFITTSSVPDKHPLQRQWPGLAQEHTFCQEDTVITRSQIIDIVMPRLTVTGQEDTNNAYCNKKSIPTGKKSKKNHCK